VSFHTVGQNLAHVFWHLGWLRHVYGRTLNLRCCVFDGQVSETPAHLVALEWRDEDPSFALLAGTASTSKTMNVRISIAGKTDLEDMGDIWEVHTAGCDVGREQNAGVAYTEVLCGAGTLCLG
jgi:hypothetical protein